MQTNEFGPLIKAINTEIQKHINNHLAALPTERLRPTGPQMSIMSYLYDHEAEPIYQSELEKVFSLSRPTINGLIKRMRENDMITVTPDSQDKRFKRIALTPATYQEMKVHHPEFARDIALMEAQMTRGMTTAEVAAFHDLLQRALRNMQALDEI